LEYERIILEKPKSRSQRFSVVIGKQQLLEMALDAGAVPKKVV